MKNHKAGQPSVYDFLTNANIKLDIPKQVQSKDQKKENSQKEAGRKLVGAMKYSWNYYFRLIKKVQTDTREEANALINEDTLANAKEDIQKNLKALKDSRYCWFNYTVDGLDDMEKEKK